MKIIDCIQGEEEWHAARRVIPTASEFSRIITTKGAPSTSREAYMIELAVARVSDYVENGFESYDMRRGKELEPKARRRFAMDNEVEVQEVGFCTSDDGRYGFSPDGLIVGEKQGLEIKCPKATTQVPRMLAEPALPGAYFQQVQGSLFISGYDRWYFFSYYPGLKPVQVTVYPDLEFFIALEAELDRFCDELDQLEMKLRRG